MNKISFMRRKMIAEEVKKLSEISTNQTVSCPYWNEMEVLVYKIILYAFFQAIKDMISIKSSAYAIK